MSIPGESCSAGQFLNEETQTCQDCPAGSYSSGAQRYDRWEGKLSDDIKIQAMTSKVPCSDQP